MPDFDLRPFGLDLQSGDGQLYHSESVQPDMFENCTFEAARETLRAYGYQNLPDDEQMRQMVDPGSHSGEPWTASYNVVRKLAPDLEVVVEFPTDVAASARAYGEQGYVVHIGFWCDAQANVPAVGAVVGSHAEVLLYERGTLTGWKNVWPHPTYELTDDQVRQLYDGGGILVFKRSLTGMTPEYEKNLFAGIYRWCIAQAEGREPAADGGGGVPEDQIWGQHALDLHAAHGDQAPVFWFMDMIADAQKRGIAFEATEITKLQSRLATDEAKAAVPGPQGLKGDPGPQGPVGPAGKDAVAPASPVAPSTPSSLDPSWGALLAELLRRVLGKS